MKRIHLVSQVVVLMLTMLSYAHGQSRDNRKPRTVPAEQITAEMRAKTRGKEVLVERLPEGVEGVVLEDNALRLKPGYKFVKKGGKVHVVARSASGGSGSTVPGSTGTFECGCVQGFGDCEEFFLGPLMGCKPIRYNPCSGTCTLIIKRKGVATNIIRY